MAQSVKAVVRNGRLVLHEPTALPEGTELTNGVRTGVHYFSDSYTHQHVQAMY